MGIRVLVADDFPLVREALTAALERHPDIEVVAMAADGIEALELAHDVFSTTTPEHWRPLLEADGWDPFAFTDLCEMVTAGKAPEETQKPPKKVPAPLEPGGEPARGGG